MIKPGKCVTKCTAVRYKYRILYSVCTIELRNKLKWCKKFRF